jgi:6-phosphogluconate dehydrogenase (decarboxylating)
MIQRKLLGYVSMYLFFILLSQLLHASIITIVAAAQAMDVVEVVAPILNHDDIVVHNHDSTKYHNAIRRHATEKGRIIGVIESCSG